MTWCANWWLIQCYLFVHWSEHVCVGLIWNWDSGSWWQMHWLPKCHHCCLIPNQTEIFCICSVSVANKHLCLWYPNGYALGIETYSCSPQKKCSPFKTIVVQKIIPLPVLCLLQFPLHCCFVLQDSILLSINPLWVIIFQET